MAENKIENSVHYKFILDCIAKGLSTVQIRKALRFLCLFLPPTQAGFYRRIGL